MAARAPKVTGPRLPPVRLEDLRDDPAPDFQQGERYDGVRYSRVAADGLELSGGHSVVFTERTVGKWKVSLGRPTMTVVFIA